MHRFPSTSLATLRSRVLQARYLRSTVQDHANARSPIRNDPFQFLRPFHCYPASAIRTSRRAISFRSLQWHPQRRNATFRAAATKLFKEKPFSFPLASLTILVGMGTLIWANYVYQVYIVGEFTGYPEPVAAKLRRALYYTNVSLEPKLAIKYYRQAIELANELRMDDFSDEMLGVKIQLSTLFEKVKAYATAIEVLEIVRSDNLKWLKLEGDKEGQVGNRTRVLGKTIGISVKLGEYYAGDTINDPEMAEERLVWAVTTLFKEQRRREVEGVREGEGKWMNDEEIGGALEALATQYTRASKSYLAAPLYLQALSLSPPKSCHTVTLMNNLATSLALQNPPPTYGQPPASAAAHITNARVWAKKAIALAGELKPPERTEECDEGCTVATINLGDFARMEGDLAEARRKWEEGRGLAKAIGFGEGVAKAHEGLRGLDKT